MPSHIADVINILRHEKLPKQRQWSWIGDEDPPCNHLARKVADGIVDKQKQDAIYVRLGKDSSVASTPLQITKGMVNEVLKKTQRFGQFFFRSENKFQPNESIDYMKIFWTFKLLFGLCTIEEYEKKWWV